jgi:hypothetical protein
MSVTVFDPTSGEQYDVAEEQVQALTDRGMRVVGADERASLAAEKAREAYYTTPGQRIRAGAAGVARGMSFGLSDVVGRAMGAEDDLRALRDYNAGESFVGELGGSVATGRAFSGGGAAAEGAGALTRVGQAAKGAAFEGALFGAGSGISEVALSDDPLTIENIMATVGSHTLFGAGAGGAAGALTSGAGAVLRRAKSSLDDIAKGETRLAAVDDVASYQAAVKDANPWLIMDEGSQAARLNQTNRRITKALDDPEALTKSPQSVLKPLRVQQKAIEETIAAADDKIAKLGATSKKMAAEVTEQVGKLADDVDEVVLSGRTARRYAAFADVKLPKGKPITVTREQAGTFAKALDDGMILGSGQRSLDNLGGLLEQNKALQAKIEAGIAKPGGAQSLASNMLGGQAYGLGAGLAGMVPVVGGFLAPVVGGAFAKVATEGLGKAAAKTAARASKAIDTFLAVSGKAPNVAPVISSKIFASTKFGAGKSTAPKSLAEGYKQRTDEIKTQTMYGPDGKAVMRPEARQKMARSFDGIRPHSPIAADRMETIAARKVEFLANNLPRRPDLGGIDTGPDRWQPSEMDMRRTARFIAAVEDPIGIVERMANGAITPEDAQVMREVYPEMYADIQQQIMAKLPTLQKTLPYQRRLAMSIFSGIPVDPAMNPRILTELQAAYEDEPGTEGGEMGPRPQPAFGSVKNQEATPSQARQGLT